MSLACSTKTTKPLTALKVPNQASRSTFAMSLVQITPSHIEAGLLYVVNVVSYFEAETLHIPSSLCFFTAGAEPEQLHRQATLFLLAPLQAFLLMPLLDMVQSIYLSRPRPIREGLFKYGRWYLQLIITFWTAILIVRALPHNSFNASALTGHQNRHLR